MNVNEKLLNKEISHAIDVLGYSNAITKKIINILNKADVDLFNRLTLELNKVIPSPEKISRIKALLRSVNDINSNAYTKVSDQLNLDLKQFSQEEVSYQQKLIGSVQPVKVLPISAEAVYAAAIATPFQGKFLKEFLSGMETQKANLIRDAVRIGFIESQTTGEIVNKIRGTKALNYTDGIMNISRANAESVVLTAIAHTANVAQQALYDANEDIIKGYRYTATLDTRTTELCASRDGNYYPLGEPKPSIPAHFRCRSRYVAVIKSFKELGLDVDLPESTRASMDGQVPAKTTYQEWLKKQSVERQNEVLGVTKAKLFREGGLPIDKFVSPSGHVYTLNELKIRNAKAFDAITPDNFIRSPNLTEQEKTVETKFYNAITADKKGLMNKYRELYGNVIDPDLAKTLSFDFVRNRDLVAAVHEPSSYLAKELYADALKAKEKSKDMRPTLFTAGGSGSGKSTTTRMASEILNLGKDPLIYDSVLGSFNSAKAKIEQALELTNSPVAIVYTNTPITKALEFNAKRDRAVSIDVLLRAHTGASNTIRELADYYKDNPRVSIQVINNNGTVNGTNLGKVADVYKYDGKTKDELKAIALNLLESDQINKSRYDLLIDKAI
jgi:SPP1 gp7 family putative phage head morphogenesis protein